MCNAININVLRGDTWNGREFQFLRENTPINLTGCTIKCDWKLGVKIVKTFTELQGLPITDAANGKIKFLQFVVDLPIEEYKFDIQISFANGTIKTYVKGTINVHQDVTI